MIEQLMQDPRIISRLTIAINSIVAQQLYDGRADRPWLYDDVQRMLQMVWYLDLENPDKRSDHYELVSTVQVPTDKRLTDISKMLADRAEEKSKKAPRTDIRETIAAAINKIDEA